MAIIDIDNPPVKPPIKKHIKVDKRKYIPCSSYVEAAHIITQLEKMKGVNAYYNSESRNNASFELTGVSLSSYNDSGKRSPMLVTRPTGTSISPFLTPVDTAEQLVAV